jgi:hypothetical protein
MACSMNVFALRRYYLKCTMNLCVVLCEGDASVDCEYMPSILIEICCGKAGSYLAQKAERGNERTILKHANPI